MCKLEQKKTKANKTKRYISDRYVRTKPGWYRILVLIASNLIAAPFALGALVLPVPWCYLSLIPSNVIGEMWVGICLALGMCVRVYIYIDCTVIFLFHMC